MNKPSNLCVVPDTVAMTREYFQGLLKKYRHHRALSFGFSKKHTADILKYRKTVGADEETTLPSNLYSFPVEWNAMQTYVR